MLHYMPKPQCNYYIPHIKHLVLEDKLNHNHWDYFWRLSCTCVLYFNYTLSVMWHCMLMKTNGCFSCLLKLKCITQLDQQKHKISCLLTKANPWSTPALFFTFSVCVVITGHSRQSRLMSGSTDLHPWNSKLRFLLSKRSGWRLHLDKQVKLSPPTNLSDTKW